MTVHQFEQPRLVDVAGNHRAILQHVDAQQGGFQAEIARQAMQGRARSEHIAHAVFPVFRQPVGEVHQHQLLGLHPCLLHVLHEVALLRHCHLAVPTRGDAAGAQRLFVEVAHLAAGQAHQAALDQAPGQFAGRARTDGIDPGVDLHPGRNAEHRLLLAHHPGNIPCCAITTGEQDQGDTGLLQALDRQPGIRRAADRSLPLAEQAMAEAHALEQLATHGPGKGQELDLLDQRQQALQGYPGALQRTWFGASGQGLGGHPVATLQGDRATQPGQGIDHQPQAKHVHTHPRANSRTPTPVGPL